MALKCQTATKDHRCDTCGRKIPTGDRYWRNHVTVKLGEYPTERGYREHTNCLMYEHLELMPHGYNNNLPMPKRGERSDNSLERDYERT